ncbi:hypothetical protein BOTBODRAFT_73929, partial [Botryobasidium botryosum FD-172 SS1]
KRASSGRQYAASYLRRRGVHVHRKRVVGSLKRLDALGTALRHADTIKRRTYTVPRPNAVWGLDGNHKLIRWGVVLHGIIDTFCRTV